jgi:hypothetical protein
MYMYTFCNAVKLSNACMSCHNQQRRIGRRCLSRDETTNAFM